MLSEARLKKLNFGALENRLWWLDPHRRFVKQLPMGARLLDFGCGNGDVLRRFHEVRPDLEITGVDVKDFSADVEGKGGDFLLIKRVEDIKSLGENSFDAIICLHVLEHVDCSDYGNLMESFYYVLRREGEVFIETPHAKSVWLPSFSLFSSDGGPLNFYDDPTHLRPFTKPSLSRLVSSHFKIRVVRCYRNGLFVILAPLFILLGILSRRLLVIGLQNILGWAIYAQLEKK